jgi:hypothetical protein
MAVEPQNTPRRSPAVLADTADQPNLPEVSGTSFPLLTTVLAGFAVTIAVQMIIRPEDGAELSTRSIVAIVVFLASTLVFISSIVFAVNAQAHNYLPFLAGSDDVTHLIAIEDHQRWISWLHRGWETFHIAAIATFYAGIALLLTGVNLIVWEFVGSGVALIVLLLIIANVLLTLTVGVAIERRKRRTQCVSGLRVYAHAPTVAKESMKPETIAYHE